MTSNYAGRASDKRPQTGRGARGIPATGLRHMAFMGRRRTARLVAAALPLGRNRWFHPMERSQLYGSISLNVIVVNQNFAFHSSPRPRNCFCINITCLLPSIGLL
ncbi:hypothetical protein CDAR_9941 [Caerostris darwini]|uniref:Uncharacterized protein n=1 Tax=Caerostris darwini TaxID=1538125 RepID=A0AAV4R259_9ARAC|nr:hypothetical protein CDAR_9941 [Caerostris darwini]